MRDVIDDGGLAFPMPVEGRDFHVGMSLRDYFAAAALQGLLANPDNARSRIKAEELPSSYAVSAYAIADAMIRARKSGTPS